MSPGKQSDFKGFSLSGDFWLLIQFLINYKVLKFSLHDLALVGVFPFCVSYPVCWLTLAHNSYNPFCFCWINNSVPTFISDFNNLFFSPFHLVLLTKSLSICWSLKKNYWPHFLYYLFNIFSRTHLQNYYYSLAKQTRVC